eukprot:TRINITY_DN55626_c0_g1_i1.p1 TRINITY_DN55626_c0_g1~~TRINITY_DN55626_c0_g1_i1.p1  ORF type:complete len:402 (+),score=27.51 TRINITY_DN55626_c0_g1_i1:35-1240(+)
MFRVFWLTGTNPYINLSIEECLFRALDFTATPRTLLVWQNKPSIHIGRFQNPWLEANLDHVAPPEANPPTSHTEPSSSNLNLFAHPTDEVLLVRRSSGGGTVFQDWGNFCLTFLAPTLEKQWNYGIVRNALAKKFHVPLDTFDVTQRTDLLANGKKISGSAFRISGRRAYHHCTLLVDSDLNRLREMLRVKSPVGELECTAASRSVRKSVTNISEVVGRRGLSWRSVAESVIEMYREACEADGLKGADVEYINEKYIQQLQQQPRFQAHLEKIQSDQWIWGNTPTFSHMLCSTFDWGTLQLQMCVQKGILTGPDLQLDIPGMAGEDHLQLQTLLEQKLEGCWYHPKTLSAAALQANGGGLPGETRGIVGDISAKLGKCYALDHPQIPTCHMGKESAANWQF